MKKQMLLASLVGLLAGPLLANQHDRILRGSDVERKTRKERTVKTTVEEREELKPMQEVRRQKRTKPKCVECKLDKEAVMQKIRELHGDPSGPNRPEKSVRSLAHASKNPRLKERIDRMRAKESAKRA